MLISPDHKFIFFKSMKTASSSVEFSLLQICGENALCVGGTPEEALQGYVAKNNTFVDDGFIVERFHSHAWPDLFYEQIANPEFFKDYKKITVVRNPWDALVSWYWWGIYQRAEDNAWLRIKENDSRDVAQAKFKEFLNVKSTHESIEKIDEIVRTSPLWYLAEFNQKFIHDSIDFYLRFENLQDEYFSLCEKLKIPMTRLSRFKSTQRKLKHHYSYYYTDETMNMVKKQFQPLIKKFNYSFEENND